jgi:DNA-binding response OmpR family regulator
VTGKVRVLVVDDNVDAADSCALLLSFAGYEAHVAYTSESAIAMARVVQPDIAILDIGLPITSGLEVCKRIRSESPNRDVRCIALSGWTDEAMRENAEEVGFLLYLIKPVGMDALYKAINTVIEKPN